MIANVATKTNVLFVRIDCDSIPQTNVVENSIVRGLNGLDTPKIADCSVSDLFDCLTDYLKGL